MSGTRNTLVSITCIVFSSRRSCMGSQIINRQCLGRLRARQQGLHEADAQQLQLRGLGHPSCDGRASTAGGTFEAELTPSPRAPPGGTISKHPRPRSTVEASLPSAILMEVFLLFIQKIFLKLLQEATIYSKKKCSPCSENMLSFM